MKTSVFLGTVAAATLMAGAGMADTLADVKARGELNCGVNTGLVGFAAPDANGNWTGFDVDICKAVAAAVLGDPAALARLERIVHPLVRDEERRFLAAARRRGEPLVVLDIPLLFETRGEGRCGAVLVVSAPAAVQRRRVLRRPGMTEERLRAILARQVPDSEKRRRADHVVRTGLSRFHAQRAIRAIVKGHRPA